MRREHNIQSLLPSGYRQLEYIESTGTQYIDTGVNADSNLSVKIKMANHGTGFTNINITGAINASPIIRHHLNFNNSPRGIVYFFGNDIDSRYAIKTSRVPNDSEIFTIHLDAVNHKFWYNSLSWNTTTASFDVGYNYWLFARSNVVQYGKLRIYDAQFADANTIVRDYIPAIRIADSKPGLYDLVNNQFYTNSGTGEFLYN